MIKNGNKNRKIKLMFKTDNQLLAPSPPCPTSSFPRIKDALNVDEHRFLHESIIMEL